jgi:hypothetical protein
MASKSGTSSIMHLATVYSLAKLCRSSMNCSFRYSRIRFTRRRFSTQPPPKGPPGQDNPKPDAQDAAENKVPVHYWPLFFHPLPPAYHAPVAVVRQALYRQLNARNHPCLAVGAGHGLDSPIPPSVPILAPFSRVVNGPPAQPGTIKAPASSNIGAISQNFPVAFISETSFTAFWHIVFCFLQPLQAMSMPARKSTRSQ